MALRGHKWLSGKDAGLLLASLFLAAGIWLLYNLSLDSSATLRTTVYAMSDIEGCPGRSVEPVTIEARLRASGRGILRIHRQEKRPPGTIRISPEHFHKVSSGIYSVSSNELALYAEQLYGNQARIESFSSPAVTFRFQEQYSKKVAVIPVFHFGCRPQYMLSSEVTIEPDSVLVYGEEGELDNIERVFTQSLSFGKLRSSRSGAVKVECPPGLKLSREEVSYSFSVSRYVEVRRRVPVMVRNVPHGRGLIVYPATCEVLLRLPFPVSGDHSADNLEFYVDYNDFHSSLSGRCVLRHTPLPDGVLGLEMVPEVFDCAEELTR